MANIAAFAPLPRPALQALRSAAQSTTRLQSVLQNRTPKRLPAPFSQHTARTERTMHMVSRRRMRRMFLVPAIAAALILLAFFRDAISEAWSSPPALRSGAAQTKTVTVVMEQMKTVLKEDAEDAPAPPQNDKRAKPTRQHLFRSNGLMEVNPDGRHPLFELIERGEAKWAAKIKRQSRTLQEAVKEYKRRHKRAPPAGFDKWWDYCQANEVQLPDEYDQIYRDLEPFWGMEPHDLRRLQAAHEGHMDSYTIGKDNAADPVSVLKVSFSYTGSEKDKAHRGQALEMIGTLKDVQQWLPPFRAVFSPHDNPNLFTDWEVRSMMVRAAGAGKYVDISRLPEVKLNGWLAACDPRSPARSTPFDLDTPLPPPNPLKKTFIYDHTKAMDPCLHPSLLRLSGQYLAHNYGPIPERLLVPQFSYSSTPVHHDILPATPINWVADTDPRDDVPWAEKAEERLLWRGTSTGIWHDVGMRWRPQQRMRLVQLANERAGHVDILPPRETREEKVGLPEMWPAARVNPAMMDVVFAGEPNSCQKATCEEMRKMVPFREMMGPEEAGMYKYVFDTDGHGWSSRYKRLLVSRSLIFKATVYPEWFAGRIQEYVHYIPIQMDYSDLHDALMFFRGDLNGDFGHDDLAEKIAEQGREWALNFWRKEDLTAYMFRLMLEYARLTSLDREGMSYKNPEFDMDDDI
ncbi:hypothetical protein HWV62_16184 [Athelia sp. TMB]|nr:hypothetical protein HWV62_16184 [Athelia sp. TMB]